MLLMKVVRYTLKNPQIKFHEEDLHGLGMGDLQSFVAIVFLSTFLWGDALKSILP